MPELTLHEWETIMQQTADEYVLIEHAMALGMPSFEAIEYVEYGDVDSLRSWIEGKKTMPEIEAYKLVLTNDKEYQTIHGQLTHHGFIRSEPLVADLVHIGYVYVKFDKWYVAYDFIIVSIVAE